MLGRLLALSAVMGVAMGATVHTVTVGKGNHKFEPQIVTAEPGDLISFEFYPLNHSVVRMDPTTPCFPWETYNKDGKGWWSHFFPIDTVGAEKITWNITVNDTAPFYYYCSAPGSCIDYQMIGAVNPPNATYIEKVAADAAEAPYSMSPGDPFQGDSRATPTPTASSSSSESSSSSSSGVSLSVGAIAGIAIGGVAALALIGLLFFFVGRKKKGAEMKETKTASPEDGLMGHVDPPVYQDPRYPSGVPGVAGGAAAAGAPGHWDNKNTNDPRNSTVPMSENSNRISELPDTSTYDPVEIYTPGPEDMPAHRR